MQRVVLALFGTCLVLSACGGEAKTATSIADGPIGAGLRGPSGLEAVVYATGIPHASAFAVDDRGRLWVAASGATAHRSDGVYLVRSAGARPLKVVSGLAAPLGLVWDDGSLYVSSLGAVYAYRGFDGTRFATRRTVLNGPVAGGENNNLVLAANGRLLMGVSASCDHCVPSSRFSGAIVSFKPDGSDLRVYARRIRAAFGLAFDPTTHLLFASMNQRDDLGARTPGDWLGIIRRGSDWAFPRCYGQGGTACLRVPQPVAVLDPHAAAGSVAILAGQLGTDDPTAIVAEWQLGKVMEISLHRSGSTYTGTAQAFITGIKSPLPLILLRSGALLVGDWATGTIYRIANAD